MEIDHIFVFTDQPAAAAQELVEFGLTEGPGRRHPGQGTTNRKFYFENFFLEVLWVHDATEITSPALLPTQLWQRARSAETGASPFGLCLVNTPDTEAVFAAARPYQPAYFPVGMVIDVLPQEQSPSLPWTFRLPFKGEKMTAAEPVPPHPAGLQQLTRASFGLRHYPVGEPFLAQVAGQPALHFAPTLDNTLLLTFDQHRQGKTRQFETLHLRIAY